MATMARSQRILRDEYLDVKWPNRDKRSDGWIGDGAHQDTGPPEQGGSDHNPNKRGAVNGLDVDKDGIHVPTVIAAMLCHQSTRYVIFNRRIMSSTYGFKPRAYTGSNPHSGHIHRSVFQSATAENRVSGYKFITTGITWPTLRRGMKGAQVGELQAYLIGWGYGVAMDRDFGPATEAAVRAFQGSQRIAVDGVVGAQTRAKLRPFK